MPCPAVAVLLAWHGLPLQITKLGANNESYHIYRSRTIPVPADSPETREGRAWRSSHRLVRSAIACSPGRPPGMEVAHSVTDGAQLWDACGVGDVNRVKALLKKGVDVNATGIWVRPGIISRVTGPCASGGTHQESDLVI